MNVVAHYKITESDSDLDTGRVMDITTEGMRLQGPLPFAVNTTSTFEMTIPQEDNIGSSLLFDANVAWCKESATPGMYDSGISLWNISEEDCDYLQRLVASITTEPPTPEDHPFRPSRY